MRSQVIYVVITIRGDLSASEIIRSYLSAPLMHVYCEDLLTEKEPFELISSYMRSARVDCRVDVL